MRVNVKIIRLRARMEDTGRKMLDAMGTEEYQHRRKIYRQRSKIYERAYKALQERGR